MREISKALSDVIFDVCHKIVSNAKYDKTYRCRIISKISDNKYIVVKDNVQHVVIGKNEYGIDQIVYVLLPENSWLNAIIL